MTSRWAAAPASPAAAALHTAGFPSPLADLLAQRGLADPAEAARFLAPSLEQLSPELPAMAAIAERLAAAGARGERLAVVGDYDVDGVSATALMAASLAALGAEVSTVLPRRDGEGYGLQALHVERAVREGATLVVAVDSGTSAFAAWEAAERAGVDLVVVDHHLPGGPSPAAVANGRWLLNPRLAPAPGGAAELTAAGLAARLAAALFARAGRPVPWPGLLRLAALGTIADVAPLTGDNRILAALGVAALAETPSPGLRELLRRAAVRPPLAAADVAFRLAPRLNAAGRLADADAALELL
ncbi:MAG: DHH family phosphoesterase, partial [Thermoanaerobaculia bacterium]|nr:DHH family phosphoesterase [Thermoanaerobaculia bacterium]